MRGEAVPEQVRVHATGLESCLCGQLTDDQERAGAGERPAAGVEEELRAMARVEVRPAVREVAPERLGGLPPDRHDPPLVALADAADEPLLEVDGVPHEADGLAHAPPRP